MKLFHIIFIALSSIMAFVVGILGFNAYQNGGEKFLLALGLFCILMSLGLVVYGIFFLQKMKGIK